MTTALYSSKEVAGIIRVSIGALCKWRARGVGPHWTRYGSLVYYEAGDVRDYIARVGPIPTGLTARETQTFFTEAHATPDPKPVPEPVPEPEPEAIVELGLRVAALEKAVIALRADIPKPKRKRWTAADQPKRRKYRTTRLGKAKSQPKLTNLASGEAKSQPKLTGNASPEALPQPKPKRQKRTVAKRKYRKRRVLIEGIPY